MYNVSSDGAAIKRSYLVAVVLSPLVVVVSSNSHIRNRGCPNGTTSTSTAVSSVAVDMMMTMFLDALRLIDFCSLCVCVCVCVWIVVSLSLSLFLRKSEWS